MSTSLTATSPPLPLAELHLPPEPGIFPFAWGWWVILVIALISIVFCIYAIYQKIKQQRAKKAALNSLTTCQSIAEINTLLKRAALSYYPRESVASLTTFKWLDFLDEQLKPSERGFVAMQNQWINGSFSANEENSQTLAQAKEMAAIWLKKALPAKKNRSKRSIKNV